MAIQSDETLVTKGNLKELYQDKILPYLGGNIALSSNVSDCYSEDEKIVGIWDDGKPLYQKSYHFTGAPIPAGTWTSIADLSSLNIDICIFSGYCKNNTNGQILSIPYDDQGTYFAVQIEPTNKTLYVRTNYVTNINGLYCVVLRYTKTTDTANSAITTPGCYDITRPDLWPTGKEIFFGNGLYGYRKTGTITAAIDARIWTDIVTLPTGVLPSIIQSGGWIKWGDEGEHDYKYPVNSAMTNLTGWGSTLGAWSVIRTANSQIALWNTCGLTRTNAPYDVWCTYTK